MFCATAWGAVFPSYVPIYPDTNQFMFTARRLNLVIGAANYLTYWTPLGLGNSPWYVISTNAVGLASGGTASRIATTNNLGLVLEADDGAGNGTIYLRAGASNWWMINNGGVLVPIGNRDVGTSSDRVQNFYGSTTFDLNGVLWRTGTGSPEGAVIAPVGSYYSQSDGGVGTSLWIKETGAGNTGWSPVTTVATTSSWTNIGGVLQPISGTSVLVTNLTSARRLTVDGAFLLTGILSTNLVTGTNGLNPYQVGVIQATGPTATPTDTTISLSAGNGAGQILIIENYTDAKGFCLTNNTPRWDNPALRVRLAQGDWCPIVQGESLWLRQDSHGDWVEVARPGSSTNLYGVINPTIGRIPTKGDTNRFDDSPLLVSASTNVLADGELLTSIDPKWFGAKGDSTTDDTTAIRAAITNATSYFSSGWYGSPIPHATVKFSRGTYRITDTLVIDEPVNLDFAEGAVLYVDAVTNGIVVEPSVGSISSMSIHGLVIERSSQDTNDVTHGLWLKGSTRGFDLDIKRVWGFFNGVKVGDDTGAYSSAGYHTIKLGNILGCKKALTLWAGSANGWCNANSIFGGELDVSSASGTNVTALVIGYGTTVYPPQANNFYGLSIEATITTNAALANLIRCSGSYNRFYGLRLEATAAAQTIHLEPEAEYNAFDLNSANATTIPTIFADGIGVNDVSLNGYRILHSKIGIGGMPSVDLDVVSTNAIPYIRAMHNLGGLTNTRVELTASQYTGVTKINSAGSDADPDLIFTFSDVEKLRLTKGGSLHPASYIVLPNNTPLYGSNAVANAGVAAISINASDQVVVAPSGTATLLSGSTTRGNSGYWDQLYIQDDVSPGYLTFLRADSGTKGYMGFGVTDTNDMVINSNFGDVELSAAGALLGYVSSTDSTNRSLFLTNTATFLGRGSGVGLTGSDNVGVGQQTLTATSGLIENTAVGSHALNASQANGNTAVGAYALWKATTGGANTAVGDAALGYNTIGGENTAIGINAGVGNVGGYGNIFIGAENHTSGNNSLNNAILIGTSIVGTNDNEIIIGNVTNTRAVFPGTGGIHAAASTFTGEVIGVNATNQQGLVTLSQLQSASANGVVSYFNTAADAGSAGFTFTGTVKGTNWNSAGTLGALWTNSAVTAANNEYIAAFVTTNTYASVAQGLATVDIYAFENSAGSGAISAELYIINSVTKAEEYEFTPSPAYQTVNAGTTPTKLTFSIPVTYYNTGTNFYLAVKVKVQESGTDPTIRIVTGAGYASYLSFNQPLSSYLPITGGTLTGPLTTPQIITYSIRPRNLVMTHVATNTLDFSTNTFQKLCLTGNVQLAFSNLETNRTFQLTVANAQATNCSYILPTNCVFMGYYPTNIVAGKTARWWFDVDPQTNSIVYATYAEQQ